MGKATMITNKMSESDKKNTKEIVTIERPKIMAMPDIDKIINDDKISIGEALVILRRANNLSRRQVCEAIKCSSRPLIVLEQRTKDNKDTIRTNVYASLCKLYNLTREQAFALSKKNAWLGVFTWDDFWEDNEPHLTVGKTLSIIRERKGITGPQMAEITQIKQSNISRLETKSLTSSKTLDKYLEGLGMGIDEFYDILIKENKRYSSKIESMIL